MSVKRHTKTSTIKKAQWAIFTKDELDNLLLQIRDFTEALEALFPATQAKLKSLAEEEVAAAQTEALREFLKKFVEGSELRDKALLDALAQATGTSDKDSRNSFNFSNGSTNNNHGLQITKDATFHGAMNFGGGTMNFGGGGNS